MDIPEVSTRDAFKVTLAATIGTLIEFYDLFIAGLAAAIAWPQLFFPQSNLGLAAAASVSAYAVTLLVRPLGAFVFGHIGDRVGRKQTMIWTLVLMGVGVLGVALTPAYATIGVLAPALVIIFRILQGLGLGGEYGGAASWVAEVTARSKWRPFWTSWIQADAVGGSVLAAFAFTLTGMYMSQADVVSYGWRLIFIAGAVGIAFAGLIRFQLTESPLFERLKLNKTIAKLPSIQVLQTNWKAVMALAVMALPTLGIVNLVISPFSVQYLAALRVNTTVVTEYIVLSGLIATALHILGGIVSSITGKKRIIMILSSLSYAVLVFPYFYLLGTKSYTLILLALILLYAVPRPGAAVIPAMLTDYFETKYRISGSGLAYQIGSLIIGIIVSFLIPLLISTQGGAIGAVPYVAALYLMVSVASLLVTVFYLKDIRDLPP